MQELDQYLALSLKRLRTEKGWSLDRTSQATGVSKAMLGQIERGESSPTVATLWKIAGGMDTPLSTFLEPAPVEHFGTIQRSADDLRNQPASDEMLIAPLFPFESRFGFEVLELTLPPGYERLSDPHEAGVTEHVIVQSGDMEVLLRGDWVPVAKGEALRFSADQYHGYRNCKDNPAVFYNLIHYRSQIETRE